MTGSRLGRSRGGRLAVYGGCGVVVVLLVFLYRAATSEMARLRELHVQCAHQQEALTAQLQVIFEYKVRLEKSLAEEKSSNAAVKQELQQRASREKSLRDKDSIEAMQRYNSLQQSKNMLETELQDLQEKYKKREKQALEDTNRLEAMLRNQAKQAKEEREKALEHLKNRFFELDTEKTKLEEKYNQILNNNGNTNSTIEHLRKEVFQLRRELEEAKRASKKAAIVPDNVEPSQQQEAPEKSGGARKGEQLIVSQQQQVSEPSEDNKNPQPLHAPAADHRAIGDPLINEQPNNEEANEVNNIRFAQENGNIVPVGPNELKETEARLSKPLPYDFQEKRQEAEDEDQAIDPLASNDKESPDEEQMRQVIPPPNENNEKAAEGKKSSSKWPRNEMEKNIDSLVHAVEKDAPVANAQRVKKTEEDELDNLQSQTTVATSSMKSIPAVKAETSTSSSNNPVSTAADRVLPLQKPASKAKLPIGVVPIPVMIDQKLENLEERREEVVRRKEELQLKNNLDSNENKMENGNLEPPFPAIPGRHEEQVGERRGNGRFNVGPGVQEIGDELNHPRLPGLDDGGDQNGEAGDDQYEGGDYDKEPQQKNSDLHLVEGEDEGEDEED